MTGLLFRILLLAAPVAAAAANCPVDEFLDVGAHPGAGAGYPAPQVAVSCEDDELVVRSNAIPHYEFVPVTPNPLRALDREYRMPLRPALAEEPSPLPLLGPSGVAVNGIPLFGPNEGPVPAPGFGDPIFNAIMDDCMGHTARQYHYHALVEACLGAGRAPGEPSPVLAYAADGFPVYGPFGCIDAACSRVVEFRSSWVEVRSPRIDAWDAYRFEPRPGSEYLDRCNGHSGEDRGGAYHYHATATWPYILGCFSGTPSAVAGRAEDRQPGGPGPQGGAPPLDVRPAPDQVARAAAELGIAEDRLAAALRLTGGRVAPMNFAASARALGIDVRDLAAALGVPAPPGGQPGRRRGRRGPAGGRPPPRPR